MSRKVLPEINAGSMADIAFLLLIFFLVTTTMDVDSGIARKLPPKNDIPVDIDVNSKNILEVSINKNNELFIENEVISISELKEIALNFIDNGTGLDINKKPCDWCKGSKNPNSSEHPTKAIIAISADRDTSYETYITVLDKLNSSYSILRNRLSKELYNVSYSELLKTAKDSPKNSKEIAEKIKVIRSKYPLLISDAEIKH